MACSQIYRELLSLVTYLQVHSKKKVVKRVILFQLVLFYIEGLHVVVRTYIDLPLPGKHNKIRGKRNSKYLSTNAQSVDSALTIQLHNYHGFLPLIQSFFPRF